MDLWTAHPACPPHHRPALERAVNACGPAWREAPATGEVFESVIQCERRLRCFSLVSGFDLVRSGGGGEKSPMCRFSCGFHGISTRNTRGLEQRVERDEAGTVISRRQRQGTNVRQTGCTWSCVVSLKFTGQRHASSKGWVLTVKDLTHSGHELAIDPLVFPNQLKRLEEYQQQIMIAREHRQAVIPYSASRGVADATAAFRVGQIRSDLSVNLI
jgi:hypothetical protein